MTQAKIHLIVSMQKLTLLVFCTHAYACQFRVLHSSGAVFGRRLIFSSAEAAERSGRAWVKAACGGQQTR
ncbi:MAG TPA: hypothetical protein V6C85_38100 [Allocoleopsis sp.]